MKYIYVILLTACFLGLSSPIFAQHNLQLDDGHGHFTTISGGDPGGSFTLPSGTGSILTNNGHSSLAWLTNGNVGTTPPSGPLTIDLENNSYIGTTDNTELDFVTN